MCLFTWNCAGQLVFVLFFSASLRLFACASCLLFFAGAEHLTGLGAEDSCSLYPPSRPRGLTWSFCGRSRERTGSCILAAVSYLRPFLHQFSGMPLLPHALALPPIFQHFPFYSGPRSVPACAGFCLCFHQVLAARLLSHKAMAC